MDGKEYGDLGVAKVLADWVDEDAIDTTCIDCPHADRYYCGRPRHVLVLELPRAGETVTQRTPEE